MTRKRIQSVPSKSKCEGVETYTDFYLDQVSNLHYSNEHFFDESSVTKTTMNRRNGSATVGQTAMEIQRYASNATFTINLLHSCLGVDHVEVIEWKWNVAIFRTRCWDYTTRWLSATRKRRYRRHGQLSVPSCKIHWSRTEMSSRRLWNKAFIPASLLSTSEHVWIVS